MVPRLTRLFGKSVVMLLERGGQPDDAVTHPGNELHDSRKDVSAPNDHTHASMFIGQDKKRKHGTVPHLSR